jgi:uncharacterized membrane protein YciS (DUF1049 family)
LSRGHQFQPSAFSFCSTAGSPYRATTAAACCFGIPIAANALIASLCFLRLALDLQTGEHHFSAFPVNGLQHHWQVAECPRAASTRISGFPAREGG